MRFYEEKITNLIIPCLLGLIGVIAVLVLKPEILTSNQALGEHTISLLIPTSFPILYLFLITLNKRFTPRFSLIAPVLALIISIPFIDILSSGIIHLPLDDSFRYSFYAHNIISTPTLWGGDNLLRNTGALEYVDQPGYRYYLALAIKLCQGENRGLQVLNIVLTSFCLGYSHSCFIKERLSKSLLIKITLFWLLSSAYMFKNIVYGYSEWLTVNLAWISAALLISKKPRLSLLTYAIIPFIRQNLLIASAFMALIIFYEYRLKIKDMIIFYFIPILLPLYHNLYYAKSFKFLASQDSSLLGHLGQVNLKVIYYWISTKILGYFAIGFPAAMKYLPDANLGNPNSILEYIALLFVPFGSILCISWFIISKRKLRLYFLIVVLITILPTLLLGWGSYPRFHFVNLNICISIFITLVSIYSPRACLSNPNSKENNQRVLG